MDRHKVPTNRHKMKEVFKSGSFKRKMAQAKEKKNEEVLAKSRRMTDYLKCDKSALTSHEVNKSVLNQPQHIKHDENLNSNASNDISETLQQSASETSPSPITNISPRPASIENINFEDIGLWPEFLSPGDINYCLKMDLKIIQNCGGDLLESYKQIDKKSGKHFIRKCQTSFFERKTRNGETIKRSWLCFSSSNGHVYCIVCKLFSNTRSQFTHGGYCNWKHAAKRLTEHETSKSHLNAAIDFAGRRKEVGRIDGQLAKQAQDVANYWREILKRLISVIVFISERGLAFRGENQIFGSSKNGNYLGMLELISEYDEFLKIHIKKHGNHGKGHTNYLSASICEEIIQLIGKKVFNEIVSRIKHSKYYSISMDSTPDEGHVDQLTLIFRYLEEHTPVERFVTFMPNQGHKAKDMFLGLCRFLEENNIDINNCRGQSYDNASSMSGKYNGLQACVLAQNKLAVWVPCAAHSLNLVVQAAAECCLNAVSFFDFVEELYAYFTASTRRYQILTDCLKTSESEKPILVPKRTTTTRWSCRADATKALLRGYTQIQTALYTISQDEEDTGKSRVMALSLYKKMGKIEQGIFTVFWDDILARVNRTSEILQTPTLDVNTAAAALTSLKAYIESKRECFNEYEVRAANLVNHSQYESESQRKRKTNVRLAPLDFVQAPETEMTHSEKFRIQSFLPVLDRFKMALGQRLEAYNIVDVRFGFLNKLGQLTEEEIISASKNLVNIYSNDLEDQLGNEMLQFRIFCDQFQPEYEENVKVMSKENWMYKLLLEKNVKDCFPNVEVALRMYLSLMVTNSSGERSFSKLKLIKNRLRTSMLEDRLNVLALMSIESDILRGLEHDDLINSFIELKVRRKPICQHVPLK